MAGFTRTVNLAVSAADTHAFLSDFDRVSEWIPEIVRIEVLGDEPVRTGTRFRETRRMRNREVSAVLWVSDLHGPADGDAPYRFSITGRMLGVESSYHFKVTPDGDTNCTVDMECEIVAKNIFGRLFVGMFVKMMEKGDGDVLDRVKAVLENGQGEAAAAATAG